MDAWRCADGTGYGGALVTILGIDPGVTGAIGMVEPCVETWDMPATPLDLALLLRTFDPATTRVYVEEVHPMPKNGSIASFKLGQSFGGLMATLATLGFPTHTVSPAKWKRAMGVDADKNRTRAKAQQMFPTADLRRVKDHGRAEALLIAEYGRRQP